MIRLKDVAAAMRLSESTVSRALSGHPRIPLTTRESVRAAAARLGYVPDPALRRLAQMRWQGTHAERTASVALVRWARDDYPGLVEPLHDQLQAEARTLGYGFEDAVIGRFTSPAAAVRSLRARGVAGIIAMASTYDNAWQGFDWQHFSGVQLLTGSGRDSGLPTVRPDAFGTLLDAGRRVELLRPQSAAIALFRQNHASITDERDEAAACLVLNRWRAAGIEARPVAWFDVSESLGQEVGRWLTETRPEVAVLPNTVMDTWLESGLVRLPPDLRVIACRRLGSQRSAGYEVRFDVMARIAVQMLDVLIRTSQCGLPPVAESVVVPCVWCDGPSFPSQPMAL
jgi:LacI family transcriptional regulator